MTAPVVVPLDVRVTSKPLSSTMDQGPTSVDVGSCGFTRTMSKLVTSGPDPLSDWVRRPDQSLREPAGRTNEIKGYAISSTEVRLPIDQGPCGCAACHCFFNKARHSIVDGLCDCAACCSVTTKTNLSLRSSTPQSTDPVIVPLVKV